jgi:hypothetical protein
MDDPVLRALVRDDAYRVLRVLADGPTGRTELVSLDGEGPLVRKRIPAVFANATAWAELLDIDEPLLPRIESLYRMPDELVVVYAYVEGESLRSHVEEGGALVPAEAVRCALDLCRAAGALHARDIVHRDITPGNVVLAADGAHLLDLGIARQHDADQTRDTTTLGTWGFAAPEQFGFAQTDARSDVYAIGRVLGYALTAVLPSESGYDDALGGLAAREPELVDIIRRATSFEPSARYQSTGELAGALARDARRHETPEGDSVARYADRGTTSATETGPAPGDARSTAPPAEHGAAPSPVTHSLLGELRLLSREHPLVATALILLWTAESLVLLALVFTGVNELARGNKNWQVPQYALACIVGGWSFSCVQGATEAMLHRGEFATGTRVGSRLAAILLWRTAVAVVLFVLLVVISALFG